ncbi:hypothetical protein ACTXT7_005815 [Hymenolepis weldensis]
MLLFISVKESLAEYPPPRGKLLVHFLHQKRPNQMPNFHSWSPISWPYRDLTQTFIPLGQESDVKVHDLVNGYYKLRSFVADLNLMQDSELRAFNLKAPDNAQSSMDRRDPLPVSKLSYKCLSQ